MVRDGDGAPASRLILAVGNDGLAQGLDGGGGTRPAHERLVPYAHLHDVVAGHVAVVSPVEGGVPAREGAVGADGDA